MRIMVLLRIIRMNTKILPNKITGISTTLLIPLWAKAVEYGRSDALLQDVEAVRMLQMLDYDFNKFSTARLSQPGCCGRSSIIDHETLKFIEKHPDCVVVHLGAGLDARFERLQKPNVTAWYDLDLPDVMFIRRQLLPESGNYYLSDSLFNDSWMCTVAAYNKPVLILLEGILMYFDENEVKMFFAKIAEYLPQTTVIFDMLPPVALNKAKHHDALKNINDDERPEFKWTLVDTKIMESWQQNLKIADEFYLSQVCAKRYPCWLQLIYKTAWGRRYFDPRIVRIKLNNHIE